MDVAPRSSILTLKERGHILSEEVDNQRAADMSALTARRAQLQREAESRVAEQRTRSRGRQAVREERSAGAWSDAAAIMLAQSPPATRSGPSPGV